MGKEPIFTGIVWPQVIASEVLWPSAKFVTSKWSVIFNWDSWVFPTSYRQAPRVVQTPADHKNEPWGSVHWHVWTCSAWDTYKSKHCMTHFSCNGIVTSIESWLLSHIITSSFVPEHIWYVKGIIYLLAYTLAYFR